MAWPLTPLTTYIAGSTPYIKAFDLNAFQSAINGIFNGTLSLKAMVIDGTGGNSVTPAFAGSGRVSVGLSGATVPNSTVPFGVFGKEHIALGHALIDSAGTMVRGLNVQSEPGAVGAGNPLHPTAGEYWVVFNVAAAGLTDGWPYATASNAGSIRSATADYVTSGGFAAVRVLIRDAGASLVDSGFQVSLWAG